ncbi:DMT family transporter [Minwuia sp.]|uniref:DMT family transporter n=1 Tax=Minwuia sp. TaxID=2493630 RepID=UPI003A908ABE
MASKQMGPVEWGLLLGLSAQWSATFFFVEIGLREVGPFWLVFGRVAFGAATLWILVFATGAVRPKTARDWRDLAVMGLLNNAIPFTLIFWGQVHITAGLASILNATTPIFGVIVAHLMLADEKASPLKGLGVLFGLAGVVVLIGPDALEGLSGSLWGQIAVIGAAVSYALAGSFGRRLGRFAPPVAAAGMLTCSTVMMLPVALIAEGVPQAMPGWATWGSIVVLGVAGSGVAYILYFQILERAGATNLLLVTFLIPPGAILLGVLFLDETLMMSSILGLVLILIGLACVDGRIFRRKVRT